jgi:hypothetical protein
VYLACDHSIRLRPIKAAQIIALLVGDISKDVDIASLTSIVELSGSRKRYRISLKQMFGRAIAMGVQTKFGHAAVRAGCESWRRRGVGHFRDLRTVSNVTMEACIVETGTQKIPRSNYLQCR